MMDMLWDPSQQALVNETVVRKLFQYRVPKYGVVTVGTIASLFIELGNHGQFSLTKPILQLFLSYEASEELVIALLEQDTDPGLLEMLEEMQSMSALPSHILKRSIITGKDLLHIAVRKEDEQAVQLILRNGGLIEASTLQYAVEQGDCAIARLLLNEITAEEQQKKKLNFILRGMKIENKDMVLLIQEYYDPVDFLEMLQKGETRSTTRKWAVGIDT
jgi:hypothetical protein